MQCEAEPASRASLRLFQAYLNLPDLSLSAVLDGLATKLKSEAKSSPKYDQGLLNRDLDFLRLHHDRAIPFANISLAYNTAVTYTQWIKLDPASRQTVGIRQMTPLKLGKFLETLATKVEILLKSLRASDIYDCMLQRYPQVDPNVVVGGDAVDGGDAMNEDEGGGDAVDPAPADGGTLPGTAAAIGNGIAGGIDYRGTDNAVAGTGPIRYLRLDADQATTGRAISQEAQDAQDEAIISMTINEGFSIIQSRHEAETGVRFFTESLLRPPSSRFFCMSVIVDSDYLFAPFQTGSRMLLRLDPDDKKTPSPAEPFHSRKVQLVDLQELVDQTGLPPKVHSLLGGTTNFDDVKGFYGKGLKSNVDGLRETVELIEDRIRYHKYLDTLDEEGEETDASFEVEDWDEKQQRRWEFMNKQSYRLRKLEREYRNTPAGFHLRL